MAKISIFGVLSNIQILLHTVLRGKLVGTDEAGNKYYTGKLRDKARGLVRERRWVIYKGTPQASCVPAEWHGWLHHQTDNLPEQNAKYRKPWQKPHQPNLSGTQDAYLPPAMKTGKRDAATGDYTAWQPPQ